MEHDILTTYFDSTSWSQFLSSSRIHLGNDTRCNFPAGTLIAMMNLETKELVAVARLKNAPDSPFPCIKHHLMDSDVYSNGYGHYNKYEIYITDLHIFKDPVGYDELMILCGGDSTVKKTNIWKGSHMNFRRVRSEKPEHVQRFKRWIARFLE